MNDVPEAVLQECLDFMEQGESNAQILARYPELAGELRPFLETAVQLATLAPQPSLAAKQKSQQAFLAHAESIKSVSIQPSLWYRLRQILLPLVALGVVLILFVTTAVSVSASAIPGDALYSVKRLVEDIRLNRTSDPETAVVLIEEYREERIREVQALLRTGRSAEVVFEGEIEAIQAASWTVATVRVMIDAGTTVEGKPAVGEMARVNGRTAEGRLIASLIEVLTSSAATPEPEPTPEPTTTSEPTAIATLAPTTQPPETPTAEPTATQTATPTPQPTATITPSPLPTATPSPMPTVPPANNNDDDNDNDDNDNDDDDNDNDDDDNDNEDGGSNDNDDGGNENDDDDDDNSGSGNNDNDDDGNENDDDDDDD